MTPSSPETPRFPSPFAGLVLFFAVVGLGVVGGSALPERAALLAMPILMLVATGVAVVVFRVDVKETLHLRLPTAPDLFMAIPLAISFFILDDQIAGLSHASSPISDETLDYFRRLLTAETSLEWIEKVATIGVLAAVSEELMFRGFLQTAFLQRLTRSGAIVATAVLFMMLHVQFLPVLAAGIVLGFVTMATRSIVVPMIVHFANNVIQLLLFNLAGLETLGDPVWIPPTILLPALAMFALTIAYYSRRLEPAPESSPDDQRPEQPEPIVLPQNSTSLAEELASVPAGRRRLGWAVVAGGVATGLFVLTALFGWSLYRMQPERVHARVIEMMEQDITTALDATASSKTQEIVSAFQALHVLNDTGQLELSDLIGLQREFRELRADGSVNEDDAGEVVEAILDLALARTNPQSF